MGVCISTKFHVVEGLKGDNKAFSPLYRTSHSNRNSSDIFVYLHTVVLPISSWDLNWKRFSYQVLIPVPDFCQTLVFSENEKASWVFGINETDFKNVLIISGKDMLYCLWMEQYPRIYVPEYRYLRLDYGFINRFHTLFPAEFESEFKSKSTKHQWSRLGALWINP